MKKIILIALIFIVSFNLTAYVADDTDLTGPAHLRYLDVKVTDWFRPKEIIIRDIRSNKLLIKVTTVDENGKKKKILVPKFNLRVGGKNYRYEATSSAQEISACNENRNAKIRGSHAFINKFYNIKKRETYEMLFETTCGKEIELVYDANSTGGHVLGIWHITETAINKFKEIGNIDFWNQRIQIKWPGNGDYYSWGTVNLTRGDHWDVVGHELGHAIYDLADIGAMGGGPHRIDQCYTSNLALSEGWASFFSAWLSVKLDDPDAKFEYMVPRRAPLRFEHIPGDVCAGEKNEWRVTGFFWDIIDLNNDNETSKMTFKKLWELSFKKRFRSARYTANFLKENGVDPVLVNVLWENNFLTKL